MASLDVNRPAAQEQLATLGTQTEVATLPIMQGQQPVDIAKRAMQAAKLQGFDVLILDTAGRLHVDQQLMDEMQAVAKVSVPQEILLVVDSLNQRLRLLTIATANVTTFAGGATGTTAGWADGVGTTARFSGPRGAADGDAHDGGGKVAAADAAAAAAAAAAVAAVAAVSQRVELRADQVVGHVRLGDDDPGHGVRFQVLGSGFQVRGLGGVTGEPVVGPPAPWRGQCSWNSYSTMAV
jgi:hypothetical protein